MSRHPHRPTLDRRTLLRSFGLSLGAGAFLLEPFLRRLAAETAGDERALRRKRVVFVVQSNGMNPAHLRPEGVEGPKHGRLANADLRELALRDRTLHAALEPLAPFKDRLALIQGLSGRISRSDHSCNVGALGACPANAGTPVRTIDHALAAVLPGVFPHVGLGYADGGATMNYRLSASAPGRPAPIVCSPDLAFKSLFGSVAQGEAARNFDHTSNLLEFMADDVKRTRAALVGSEREKLDGYLAAFEALRSRQTEIAAMRETIRRHVPDLGEKRTTSVSSLILEAQFEIGAAALIAGLTNVLLLTSGGGGQAFGSFPEFGIQDLHTIGHGGMQGGQAPEECFVELRRFHTKLIAELARKLDAVKVGDRTLLDETVIVYLSDSGEAHHPNLYEWPVVLLGNLGGTLRTAGRYLEFPAYGTPKHRTLANLYCTLLHAAGKPTDVFGMPDPLLRDVDQTGPLGELLA